MAAFALLGLSIALGVVALAGLRPWATSSVAPNLSLSPAIGAALDDATVVAQADSPEVGNGGTAAPVSPGAVSPPAVVSVPKRHASTSPVLAVAPARALSAAEGPSTAAPKPALTPEPPVPTPVPPVEAAPAPALAVAPQPAVPGAPVPSGGPSTAGVGGGKQGPSCEGGEYVITVTFEEEEGEEGYEQSEADILIQGMGADGSEEELELRGDLSDVHSLLETLVSEGACVRVDIVPFGEDKPSPEAGEPGVVPTEPGDAAEAALP